MEANELRIGNFIEYFMEDSQDERKKWWEPDVVDAETILQLQTFPEDEDYRPIPLTEEWLLKFGFEKTDNYLYAIDKDKYVTFKLIAPNFNIKGNHVKYFWSPTLTSKGNEHFSLYGIEYVHQLQNLYFALTGKELTIKQQ